MTTYKVIFTNGEKRDLTVKASKIDHRSNTVLRFTRSDDGERTVAVVPMDRVLYVVEVLDND